MIVYLPLLSGGALTVTIEDGGMMGQDGQVYQLEWAPSILFLALSIMHGWVIYIRKVVRRYFIIFKKGTKMKTIN
jgi:hypothetical protein